MLFEPSPFLVFVIAAVVVAFILLVSGVKIVNQAEEWTIERFGRYTRTLSPGLHIIVPFIDRIGQRLSLRETVLDIPPQDVITLDNATVTTDGVVFFQVVDSAKAAYEVRDLERAMSNLAMTNLRSVVGSMALDDVLSRRDDINERLLRVIDAATNSWGIKVTRIEIKDLTPPRDLVNAMNQQMMAERQKRAEILQAEGDKQGDILRAEGKKQSEILRSEGEKQAAILDAEARREAAFRDAEAREREAEAEAKATTFVSDAIAAGDVQSINYFVATKYVEAFAKLAESPNQKLVMIPMEASSLIGSLGGIAEIAKDTFGDKNGPSGGKSGPDKSGPWGSSDDNG